VSFLYYGHKGFWANNVQLQGMSHFSFVESSFEIFGLSSDRYKGHFR